MNLSIMLNCYLSNCVYLKFLFVYLFIKPDTQQYKDKSISLKGFIDSQS